MNKLQRGFTAVELLVAMVIGTILLATAYQLYSFVLNDSTDTRMRATASNLAYRFLRERSAVATTNPTCGPVGSTAPTIPSDANLPSASATVTIECISNGVTLPKITSTVNYGNGKSISHATYIPAN